MQVPESTFAQRANRALHDAHLQSAIKIGTGHLVDNRAKAVAAFPAMEAFRNRARLIRAHALSQLDSYLAEFADNVAANGGHVFWAKDAAEANTYIRQLAHENNVKRIVKSKSMVTEEIALNHALEQDNIEVVESDLGEFIIQLAREKPSHIIAPVMHKSRQEVGKIFQEKLDIPYTDDPLALNDIARAHLRQIFLSADMGISGVNFAVAESGSICTVTNEGNGRFTTTAPRIHVAVMGLEKVVPTLDDLNVMLQVLARSATGQKLSVYTNIITGPRRPGEPDGPDEFHVVILDNGRSKTLATAEAEILYCIRCGACLNHCPVYQAIGGHAYGSIYPGPMGSVLTPMLQGLEHWNDLPHASTLCGKCKEVCPVHIDLPHLLLTLRDKGHRAGKSPVWLTMGMQSYRILAQRPTLFRWSLRAGSIVTRTLAQNGWIKRVPPPFAGWTDYRAFPSFAKKSFHQQWKKRMHDQE